MASVTEDKAAWIAMNPDIYASGELMMNLFFPVYHSYSVYRQTGFICISVSEEVLRSYYEGNIFDNILIADADGEILSHQNRELTGKKVEEKYAEQPFPQGVDGVRYRGGIYYFISEISSCGWYVTAELSLYGILKGAAGVLLMSVFVMCLMCTCSDQFRCSQSDLGIYV